MRSSHAHSACRPAASAQPARASSPGYAEIRASPAPSPTTWISRIRKAGMRSPIVTEVPSRLEAVTPDPFIEGLDWRIAQPQRAVARSVTAAATAHSVGASASMPQCVALTSRTRPATSTVAMRRAILRSTLTELGSDQLGHLGLHQLGRDGLERLADHVGVLVEQHLPADLLDRHPVGTGHAAPPFVEP